MALLPDELHFAVFFQQKVFPMRSFFVRLAVITAAAFLSTGLSAQEPQQPGKEHEELKALEGTWDAVLKMTDGTEMKGTSEQKMTCEGMWLESSFKADFGGTPFHGKGLDSYDAAKKQYVSIWVDSMSATPMVMSGTKTGNITTMTGEGAGPEGPAKYKTVTKFDGSDKMSFTMFMVNDGKDTEVMTVNYTRRKK